MPRKKQENERKSPGPSKALKRRLARSMEKLRNARPPAEIGGDHDLLVRLAANEAIRSAGPSTASTYTSGLQAASGLHSSESPPLTPDGAENIAPGPDGVAAGPAVSRPSYPDYIYIPIEQEHDGEQLSSDSSGNDAFNSMINNNLPPSAVSDDDQMTQAHDQNQNNNSSTSSSDAEDEDQAPIEAMEAELFDFMCEQQVTHAAMSHLLKILRRFTGKPVPSLPKDPRTLLRRHRSKKPFIAESENSFYIGIGESLVGLYAQNDDTKAAFKTAESIELAFNVDGLPISGMNHV